MNSYELSRNYFNFCFENPEIIKPIHTALYFFTIDKCNRLGWKKKFGLPTDQAMETIGVKSYKTYIKAFEDLVDWGFFKEVQRSRNQNTSNIIELVNFTKADTKADTKALDKATAIAEGKANPKQVQSTDQLTVSIDKQINLETNKQINLETTPPPKPPKPKIEFIELGEFENIKIEKDNLEKLKESYSADQIDWMIKKLGSWLVGKKKTVKSYKSLKAYFVSWVYRSYEEEKQKQSQNKDKYKGYNDAMETLNVFLGIDETENQTEPATEDTDYTTL